MQYTLMIFIAFLAMAGRQSQVVFTPSRVPQADTIPEKFKGEFVDDYGIQYRISDTLWQQLPRTSLHIIKWNVTERFIIARNDTSNITDGGLYTRIDYVELPGMEPYQWGFCLSSYNAKSSQSAEDGYKADKQNPRKGCNGFPFSRMRKK